MLTHEKICNAIASVADQYSLTRASYFGSYADGTATEQSDLDILVEFAKPVITFYDLIGLKLALEKLLELKVDVIRTPIPQKSTLIINKTVPAYG